MKVHISVPEYVNISGHYICASLSQSCHQQNRRAKEITSQKFLKKSHFAQNTQFFWTSYCVFFQFIKDETTTTVYIIIGFLLRTLQLRYYQML